MLKIHKKRAVRVFYGFFYYFYMIFPLTNN